MKKVTTVFSEEKVDGFNDWVANGRVEWQVYIVWPSTGFALDYAKIKVFYAK